MVKKMKNSDDWGGFSRAFGTESDRAAAIVGAAFLDDKLGKLLGNFIIQDADVYNEVIYSENSSAILGSFGSRITVAYALGLIRRVWYEDLKEISRIRNLFAHRLHGMSFESDEVKVRCDRFRHKVHPSDGKDSPRRQYMVAVFGLSVMINTEAESIARFREEGIRGHAVKRNGYVSGELGDGSLWNSEARYFSGE